MTPLPGKPPLRTWVIAAAATLLLGLAAANLDRLPLSGAANDRWTSYNLVRLREVPSESVHVVALGTSKTLYAVEHDQQFAARLATYGHKVIFHRITASGPEFEDLAPVLVEMTRRPPDVLLLENDLLVYHRGDASTIEVALRQIRSNILLARAMFEGEPEDLELAKNHGREHWPLESRCEQRKTPEALRAYASFAGRWRIMREEEQARYLAYLRPMQAAGTVVVLITLPRSPSAEFVVPDVLKRDGAKLRNQLVAQHHFQDLVPAPMSELLYCDQGHVNQRGREFYSTWLAGRLHELLGAR